jgi:hypothetical protein
MPDTPLPAELAHNLVPLFAEWALYTDKERAEKRAYTDLAKLREFQLRVMPHFDAIIAYLNTFPNDPDVLPGDARKLFALAQMFMEASVPLDLGWPSSDMPGMFPLDRVVFHPPSA